MDKQLTKSSDKLLAGVCSGIAEYLGWDKTIVRVLFACLVLFGGSSALIYLILWLVMPDKQN
mgnify:CR=1 FL=1